MTSDTFRSHRVPPIDLVLHALQDALSKSTCEAVANGLHDQATRSAGLASALTRAISPGTLASSWAAEGDADIAGAHLARRLANPGGTPEDPRPTSNAEGRALETAVARRLADTACSLAITGDKDDAEHARTLWEASATLTGLTTTFIAPSGFKVPTATELSAYVASRTTIANPTPRILQSADEAPCGSLVCWRDELIVRTTSGRGWFLGQPSGALPSKYGGWQWPDQEAVGPFDVLAEGLTEPECRHLSGLSAADAIMWCERRAAHAALAEVVRAKVGHAFEVTSSADAVTFTAKPRPQPGDVVPWTEVEDEDGALYFDRGNLPFYMIHAGRACWMYGDADSDVAPLLSGDYVAGAGNARDGAGSTLEPIATLVARDLGTDPEAWRRAMREWTANGNKPAAPIKDPRLEVPGALLDDLRTEAGEHSIDAETIVRSAVREIKRRRAATDILTAKRAEAESDVADWRTWAVDMGCSAPGQSWATTRARIADHVSDGRKYNTAQETADRRMALLLQADERDSMVREHLGAGDTENTVDAAKRIVKERNHYQKTTRERGEQTEAAIRERDEARAGWVKERMDAQRLVRERDAALALADKRLGAIMLQDKDAAKWREALDAVRRERDDARDHAFKTADGYVESALVGQCAAKNELSISEEARKIVIAERDRAIEARAQMQARLVAAERERDAAQEEAKNLRAARAQHFDHRRIVEVHDGDGSM